MEDKVKKYCYNCFYSRTGTKDELVHLVCCCLKSKFLWKYISTRDSCNCWESIDYEKGKINICINANEVDNVVENIKGYVKNMEDKEESKENINHPDRYNKYSMECIDEMVEVFGIDTVIDFCKCNVWKYRYRLGCEDDLKKADWYMEKIKELNNLKDVM